ncbi:MAG TPA: GuaB1 family IMP dehydrogenase-related protein, partial [Myxococcales bacterium]|nr:GuaB1 family IMP dehydrogenase-related protein [Myxococcales bacterium]
ADPQFDTPLVVTPEATLRDVQGIIRKRAHDMVVVVDKENRPLGVVTQADLRDRDQYTKVGRLMSKEMVKLRRGMSNQEAFTLMHQNRVKAAPVLDDDDKLCGLLTRDDAVRLELLKPAVNTRGELMVAVAVGISQGAADTATALVEMGVDVIVLDTAHGYQKRMLETIQNVRKAIGSSVPIVAGNVCTAEGTKALIDAGADIIKVNVGPGAMCTTRMQTGVGRPSFSSVLACANEAKQHGCHVWADGGVRHPRDVALYLAAGASRVMIGTMLCGTYESPGDIKEDPEGFLYKENYGMASARAVLERNTALTAFEKAKKGFFREGISSSRIYLQEHRESVGEIMIEIITGVQSSFTYVGTTDIPSFQEKVIVGVQTQAGFGEGTAHGRIRK